ncbi:hypothetical protein HMPREF1981_03068 [Bacteroides pyogenes F0041]|uniref:Uncharacterized protein n=1 Tax=Bacteroides pyogenes F0041 TaxID=1321819 RepID=U2BU20_9BACE|nr:hypothetical protein HMPREF1981_03068 [Bacteroides pyogenes F0041]
MRLPDKASIGFPHFLFTMPSTLVRRYENMKDIRLIHHRK